MLRRLTVLGAVAVMAGGGLLAGPAAAQAAPTVPPSTTTTTIEPSTTAPAATAPSAAPSGPRLAVSSTQVAAGDHLRVVFLDWQATTAVLTVCGNDALRGSGDCSMEGGTGVRLRHSTGDTPVHEMAVVAPPTPCPCVVRATSNDSGEVAYAAIELADHPVAPVERPTVGQPLVQVSVTAAPASDEPLDVIRRALGGSSSYALTVQVRNLAALPLSGVALHGSGRHRDDVVAEFDLVSGYIPPGETWTGVARAAVPAPAVGDYAWEVTASEAGPVVVARTTSRAVPWVLVVLVLALVGDLVAVAVRAIERRRVGRTPGGMSGPDRGPVIDVRPRPAPDHQRGADRAREAVSAAP